MRARPIRSLGDEDRYAAAGLVTATATALRHRHGDPLEEHVSRPPRPERVEAFSSWCVARYPRRRYPALVIGDRHGATVHLAAAMDAPWLPIAGHAQLPPAYRRMIEHGLRADAPVLVVSTRPGMLHADQYAIAAVARHAAATQHPTQLVRVPASVLSGTVAELYRGWLRAAGKTGSRLVVECGPLLDPWHVLRAGLVPYWCPSAQLGDVESLTWWIAGEEPYSTIEVLLQPPGRPPLAGDLDAWLGLTQFADRRGTVARICRRAYPHRPLTSRHAIKVLRQHPADRPLPPPLQLSGNPFLRPIPAVRRP
jgi:hypothetical protein